MRIRQVKISNYRQLRSFNLSFPRRGPSDLHVVCGENGTGKTNLLNAINWCLYGDEPHLSPASAQLPLANLKAIEEAGDGDRVRVIVEVCACTDDGHDLDFERRTEFVVHKELPSATTRSSGPCVLEARLVDDRGNTKIYRGAEAESCVRRFVPQEIREFFFFDGERLDTYFKQATAANIRRAVVGVSQIDLLEDVERHLDSLIKDMRRIAGKSNPKIETARQALEEAEQALAETENKIQDLKAQDAIARSRKQECEEKLRGAPDIDGLEAERDGLKRRLQGIQQLREAKRKEKNSLLVQYSIMMPLSDAIAGASQIIAVKRQRREIPPRVDRMLIEAILRQGRCVVCGRDLDPDSTKHVSQVLEEFQMSTDVAQELLSMEGPLSSFRQRIARFEQEVGRVTDEVDRYDGEAETTEQRIREIDGKIDAHDVASIKEWHHKRVIFEEMHAQIQRALGTAQEQRAQGEKRRSFYAEGLQSEMRKEQAATKLNRRLSFCERAIAILRKTKEAILEQTRRDIEAETNATFLDLLWKKQTFAGVEIGVDYSLSVIHAMGYSCLGSLGAAERELLALSFTLGLHTVSGFSAPILIDTPVARVSGPNRVNVARLLAQVAQRKQTILLFTPAEYSPDISSSLDQQASARALLRMSQDEKQTEVEVL